MNIVMGAESEYAAAAIAERDLDSHDVACRLHRIAAKSLPHLKSDDRLYLANGGCLYLDTGDKYEYAGPECSNPWDFGRYVRAGDQIMAQLAEELSDQIGAPVQIGRGNVGYGGSPTTWAAHESYLSALPTNRLVDGLVPFLVSRLIFSGGGGFDPYNNGISFSLSPRTLFIREASSDDSTNNRGIVHLKNEPLNRHGYHRIHLLCGDALGSAFGMALTAGTTALVICLLNQNYCVPRDVKPSNPVNAMRLFASDPTLTYKVPASTGIHRVTALDIQWSYLRAIEGSKLSNYPEWAPMLLQRWRRTLECLQNVGAAALSTSLDWPIKAQVYADFCDQFGIPWDKLADWNAFMEKLANSYRRVGSAMPRTLSSAVIFDAQSPVRGNRTLTTHLRKHDLNPDRLTDLQMLRNKLFEIETKYLHVGGIFEQLESAGVLDDEASLNRKAVAEATANPPHGTRAKVRGECVAELSGSKNVTCDWCGVIDRDKGRAISLDDPLAATAVWQDHKGSSGLSNEESPLGLRIDALSCYRDGEHEEARAILQSLLRIGFELPSTHCHLARVELITDNFALAAEHTEQAWALRGQAPAYVVPRIIWLQMANAMLQAHARPLTPLIGKMKTALQQTEPYEWTMTPVLDHLRAMLTDRNFNLLAMLSAVISGESAVSALESQPDWRMAAAEPVT